ncbi:Error-prone repair protein ImuA [Flaviaesturariibacter flavus]|uniref:Error-prone repair protein ImuA n=1 Tax=Flaviaesturariibacter flavus TaxID=2502780 RepID=A0A4R1B9J0_9BACT|nr:Error-prone repair protein ImuA [Flaviaesturariibacter flavus]TCJ13574.1 Error-prone repair protein ImuA [Flaviaesturariibacter flavus]
MPAKAEIFDRLRKEMLQLQGFRAPLAAGGDPLGLGRINSAFPNGVFPQAAVHEFVCAAPEEGAATSAFITGLLSGIMKEGGAVLWAGTGRRVYPPALRAFGVRPERVLFLDLKKEKDVCWALGEALRCGALSAVVGELKDLDFTGSRRFQLAIESSGVPCFLLRRNARAAATTAVARWRVAPLQSVPEEGLPGIGHPRWRVQLLKARNGRPGSWDVEWRGGAFREVLQQVAPVARLHRKAG